MVSTIFRLEDEARRPIAEFHSLAHLVSDADLDTARQMGYRVVRVRRDRHGTELGTRRIKWQTIQEVR